MILSSAVPVMVVVTVTTPQRGGPLVNLTVLPLFAIPAAVKVERSDDQHYATLSSFIIVARSHGALNRIETGPIKPAGLSGELAL